MEKDLNYKGWINQRLPNSISQGIMVTNEQVTVGRLETLIGGIFTGRIQSAILERKTQIRKPNRIFNSQRGKSNV
jgi:hypothetical protein